MQQMLFPLLDDKKPADRRQSKPPKPTAAKPAPADSALKGRTPVKSAGKATPAGDAGAKSVPRARGEESVSPEKRSPDDILVRFSDGRVGWLPRK
jgi:hypothetical protein